MTIVIRTILLSKAVSFMRITHPMSIYSLINNQVPIYPHIGTKIQLIESVLKFVHTFCVPPWKFQFVFLLPLFFFFSFLRSDRQ